jgi:hypothetical protein
MLDLSTAVLCDFAQVRDRLLFTSSGAVSRLYRQELPSPLGLMVGLVIEVPLEDAGMEHTLRAEVINRHGTVLAELQNLFRVSDEGLFPHEVQQVPLVLSITGVRARTWGTHQVRLYLDEELVRALTLYVVPAAGTQAVRPVPTQSRAPADEGEGTVGVASPDPEDEKPAEEQAPAAEPAAEEPTAEEPAAEWTPPALDTETAEAEEATPTEEAPTEEADVEATPEAEGEPETETAPEAEIEADAAAAPADDTHTDEPAAAGDAPEDPDAVGDAEPAGTEDVASEPADAESADTAGTADEAPEPAAAEATEDPAPSPWAPPSADEGAEQPIPFDFTSRPDEGAPAPVIAAERVGTADDAGVPETEAEAPDGAAEAAPAEPAASEDAPPADEASEKKRSRFAFRYRYEDDE